MPCPPSLGSAAARFISITREVPFPRWPCMLCRWVVLGMSWSKNLDVNFWASVCHLQSSNSIWVLKHFGGGRTIVDSSCAMSVVPFSGDGDPLEDRSFMPYANAFAETSRFKDVPRIIHIYICVVLFFVKFPEQIGS